MYQAAEMFWFSDYYFTFCHSLNLLWLQQHVHVRPFIYAAENTDFKLPCILRGLCIKALLMMTHAGICILRILHANAALATFCMLNLQKKIISAAEWHRQFYNIWNKKEKNWAILHGLFLWIVRVVLQCFLSLNVEVVMYLNALLCSWSDES